MRLSLDISPEHPAEHDLTRFHAGDLEKEKRDAIQAHLSTCDHCAEFIRHLDSFRQEFASSHYRQGFLALVRKEAQGDFQEAKSWWQKVFGPSRRVFLASSVATLLILAVVVFMNRNPKDNSSSIRMKGSEISLSYLVMENSRPVLAKPNRILHPRDRIQFRLSAPRGGYVHIVGVDEAGAVTVYFPLPGMEPEIYPGGSGRPVPGSIILDDTLGKERVFVLLCEKPIGRTQLEHKILGAAKDPRTWISRKSLPMNCKQTSIVLQKELP